MRRGRVLLLEDDVALRSLLVEALTGENFEVVAPATYAELLALAAADANGVVVADFWGRGQRELPDGDRREIQDLTRLMPTILLTGRSWASDVTPEELGARAVMRKPFDLDELLRAIQLALTSDGQTP